MHFPVLAESLLCVHHIGSTGLSAERGRHVVCWKMELWFGFWVVFMHIYTVHFSWEEFLVHWEEEEVEEGSSSQQIRVPWSRLLQKPTPREEQPQKTPTCWFQVGLSRAVMPRVWHSGDSPGQGGCAGCAPQAGLVQPCGVVSPLPARRPASSTAPSPSPGPAPPLPAQDRSCIKPRLSTLCIPWLWLFYHQRVPLWLSHPRNTAAQPSLRF